MSAALFAAAPLLMQTFMDVDSIVTDGTLMLRWQVAGNVFAAIVLLMTCLFQATGKMLAAFLLSISRQGVLFIIVLLAAVHIAQYHGLLASQAVADSLSALAAIGLYIAIFLRWSGQAPSE